MAEKVHYFLFATQVLYAREGLERTRNFNVMLPTENDFVNRKGLGLAQQQAQVRFYTEFDTHRTAEIKDVFILSISHLGAMTEAEFHAGFEQQVAEEEAATTEAEQPAQQGEATMAEHMRQDNADAAARGEPDVHIVAPAEGNEDTQS